jgi:hypothetical protein
MRRCFSKTGGVKKRRKQRLREKRLLLAIELQDGLLGQRPFRP